MKLIVSFLGALFTLLGMVGLLFEAEEGACLLMLDSLCYDFESRSLLERAV